MIQTPHVSQGNSYRDVTWCLIMLRVYLSTCSKAGHGSCERLLRHSVLSWAWQVMARYGKWLATQHSTAKAAKNTKISQFDPICWACDMQHDIMQHLTATQLWCQSLGWDTLESLTIHSSDSNVRTWLILINRDNMILQYITMCMHDVSSV